MKITDTTELEKRLSELEDNAIKIFIEIDEKSDPDLYNVKNRLFYKSFKLKSNYLSIIEEKIKKIYPNQTVMYKTSDYEVDFYKPYNEYYIVYSDEGNEILSKLK